jgi:hypothetical protein
MPLHVYGGSLAVAQQLLYKRMLTAMRLTILLLLASLQVCAYGGARTISLSLKNVSLEQVFNAIEKQSAYRFLYVREDIQKARPVTVNIKNASLKDVLNRCFEGQPVMYTFVGNVVVVKIQLIEKHDPASVVREMSIEVKGKVLNEKNRPVVGVEVYVKGKGIGTSTDSNGDFRLTGLDSTRVLVFAHVGLETFEYRVVRKAELLVSLRPSIQHFDLSNSDFIRWLKNVFLIFIGMCRVLVFGKRIIFASSVVQLSRVAIAWILTVVLDIGMEDFYHYLSEHTLAVPGARHIADHGMGSYFESLFSSYLFFTGLKVEVFVLERDFRKGLINKFLYYLLLSIALLWMLMAGTCRLLGDVMGKAG